MIEVALKTHLIITDIHNDYEVNWCGRLMDVNPIMQNDAPVFVVVGKNQRIELNTWDMKRIENAAKLISKPHGRTAITKDDVRIYIKDVDRSEKLMGVLTHKRVKTFAPMFDKVGWKE